jgi:hypothetical protein
MEAIKVILNKLRSAQLIIDMMKGNQKTYLLAASDGCLMESDPEGDNYYYYYYY